MTLIVRDMISQDAAEVTRLLAELGYSWPVRDVAARIDAFHTNGERALVAQRAGSSSLLGVLSLHITPVLHRAGPVGRLTMLVVDASARGTGIGRALVTAAEAYFAERGCVLVEVTSNKKRTDAHAFYERLGYRATSERFAKSIGD
jgi:ribosomal protein S18 acetylase RimI-like enzyme